MICFVVWYMFKYKLKVLKIYKLKEEIGMFCFFGRGLNDFYFFFLILSFKFNFKLRCI